MATRANNNHINGAGIGCGNSIKKIVNEWGQKLHRCYREDFEPLTVQLFFEDRSGGYQDQVCWKSVPVFHYPDREGTAPSSKTAWSLQ